MKNFIKKNVSPILKYLNLHSIIRRIYFEFRNFLIKITNRVNKRISKTAPILLYHRVASVNNDPLKLCITPEYFDEHMRFLKEHYNVIRLSELSERAIKGKLIGNEASITFDDGYEDNIRNALPILEKYGLPATIFITTGYLGEKASFAWDLEYAAEDRGRFFSEEEIKFLSDHTLIDLGAHTNVHPNLACLDEIEQEKEILESKKILEKITGKVISIFAYPFGGLHDFNALSRKIIGRNKFIYAYSNIPLLVKENNDPFSIPRINIRQCSREILSKYLYIK